MLTARGITIVIPQKSDDVAHWKRRGTRAGRLPGIDQSAYVGRNVVGRQFELAEQWRGIATRYDKHAITYHSKVLLCAVIAWLRRLGTRPRVGRTYRGCRSARHRAR